MPGTTKSLSPHGRTVLITGASSGLGRETALHLERLGYTVFAGVRREEDGAALVAEAGRADGIRPVRMDLTDEESVRRAAEQVAEATAETGLWGLVANAGTCALGPLELLPAARLREAMETNVIGHHTLTTGLLPSLRRSRGRIVNVSSGFGRLAAPFYGGYAVTQFGKEGLSDAQRRELRPFGISVSVVEPGAIATPIFDKLAAEAEHVLASAPPEKAELYRTRFLGFLRMNERRAHRIGTSPAQYARAVEHALGAARPRTRYAVGLDWQTTRAIYRGLPDRLVDKMFGAMGDRMVRENTESEAPAILRPLGPAECWYRLADSASPFNVAGRIRIEGELGAAAVTGALALMQRRHPLLRAAIRETGGKDSPVYVAVPQRPVPLRTETMTDAGTHWQRELNERELGERIDVAAGPCLRALLLSTADGRMHDLLLIASHIIADANTMLSMVGECAELAARVQAGEEPEVRARPVLAALENLVPAKRRWYRPAELVRDVAGMVRDEQATRRERPVRVVGQRAVPVTARRSRLIHAHLPAEQVSVLAKRCRGHGTTVHGALGAAMVIAAARSAPGLFGAGAREALRMTLGSPIDMRDQLDPPVATDELGAFVSMVPTHVGYDGDIDGTEPWRLARSITEDLDLRQRRGEQFGLLNLTRWLVPRELERGERALRTMDARSPANLCLSNIGRFELPEAVAGLRFSEAQLVGGLGTGCYLSAVVNTTHGELALNITHLREVIADEVADRFAGDCFALLDEWSAGD